MGWLWWSGAQIEEELEDHRRDVTGEGGLGAGVEGEVPRAEGLKDLEGHQLVDGAEMEGHTVGDAKEIVRHEGD